jgi:hypothetical protein
VQARRFGAECAGPRYCTSARGNRRAEECAKKDNKIEIENYGTEPVRLRQLKVEVRK